MQALVPQQYETVNKQFKQFGVLWQKHGHNIHDHGDMFCCVIVVKQLSIQNGRAMVLFGVDYEDPYLDVGTGTDFVYTYMIQCAACAFGMHNVQFTVSVRLAVQRSAVWSDRNFPQFLKSSHWNLRRCWFVEPTQVV